MPPGIGAQIVKDLLSRFPEAATKTLARKAYDDNPSVWSSLETCRSAFRVARGQQGDFNRKASADKTHHAPNGEHRKSWSKLPEGITSLDNWDTVPVNDPGCWAILSDIHAPYHDTGAIKIAIDEAKRRKVVGILLNGDILDCFAISRWEKDPRKRDFANEMRVASELFGYFRKTFPAARIVWKFGNHEERYDAYMQLKAPELLDIAALDFAELTQATKHGIETVRDKRRISLGKLCVLHGHEWKSPFQNPVNPARGLFNKTKASAICGHLHQSSSHSEPDVWGHLVTCWSAGCLSELHPAFMPLNKWNHGAAIVELGKDGSFAVDNFRMINGKKWS